MDVKRIEENISTVTSSSGSWSESDSFGKQEAVKEGEEREIEREIQIELETGGQDREKEKRERARKAVTTASELLSQPLRRSSMSASVCEGHKILKCLYSYCFIVTHIDE